MKVYILRHGETKLNKIGGHFQGQIDTEISALDADGRRQAEATRKEFTDRGISFDLVYTSPQDRAVETAVLATGLSEEKLIRDDRLKEQAFGPYEGQPWEKMNPATFHALMEDAGHYYPGPGMETVLHLIQRSSQFLDELAQKQPAQSILVSTHGGVVRAMLYHLHIGDLTHFWDIPVGNCAWYELTLEADGFRVTEQHPKT